LQSISQEASVRWIIAAIFILGMISSLYWYEAATSERSVTYGLMAITAFALVVLLGTTML
jgi:hypothetical protein